MTLSKQQLWTETSKTSFDLFKVLVMAVGGISCGAGPNWDSAGQTCSRVTSNPVREGRADQ